MTTQVNYDQATQITNDFGFPSCDTTYTATLKAASDTTVTVPATSAIGNMTSNLYNKFLAVIKYARATPADPVYFAKNATAAVPAGATFAASTSEIEPPAKYCRTGDVLHFICAGVADVSVSFYAIQD